jgi:hypothetical protein
VIPELCPALLETVMSRRQVFLTKGCPIKPLVGSLYDIENTGRPFKEQPFKFRVSPLQREVLEKEIKSMLKVSVIRPSKSPWSSYLLVVKKPDGSCRPCVDYRRLNKMTKPILTPSWSLMTSWPRSLRERVSLRWTSTLGSGRYP